MMDVRNGAMFCWNGEISNTVWDDLYNHLQGAGETLIEIEIENVVYRPFSEILYILGRTEQSLHRYVVKRTKPSSFDARTLPPKQAQAEHEILSRLHREFEHVDHCSVPKPVTYNGEHDILITEYVEGEVLTNRLKYLHYFSSSEGFDQLKTLFRFCGEWLRHLRDIVGISVNQELDDAYICAHCDERLAWLETGGFRQVPRGFRQAVMSYLEKLLASSRGLDIPMGGQHADFGPWNILCHRDQITVLDFVGYRVDPLPMSVMSMLVYVDTKIRGLANNKRRIVELKESFMAGYGPLPLVPQAVVLVCEAFQRVINLASAAKSERVRHIKKYERYACIRDQINWFARNPRESSLWLSKHE
jgi:hypothetical protein